MHVVNLRFISHSKPQSSPTTYSILCNRERKKGLLDETMDIDFFVFFFLFPLNISSGLIKFLRRIAIVRPYGNDIDSRRRLPVGRFNVRFIILSLFLCFSVVKLPRCTAHRL